MTMKKLLSIARRSLPTAQRRVFASLMSSLEEAIELV
jgi:hypothetical protein